MSQTHNVSLFLPNTLAFHHATEDRGRTPTPPPPPPPPPRLPPPAAEKRPSSLVDLTKRASTLSLLRSLKHPVTPTAADEDFFGSTLGPESERRYFATPGDPRSLVQSDAEVPEWGGQPVFNQPRSSAGLPLSASLLDFPKVEAELEEQKRRNSTRSRGGSPQALRLSFSHSSGGGYENKTWTVEPALQGNGGLTNAMRSASRAGSIEVSWIGTLGFPTDALPQAMREHIDDHLLNEHQCEIVYASDKDLNGHYAHYCKTILWPVFHYLVPDHPKSKAYADHSWQFYVNVNQAFASKVISSYKRGDIIWVHDYHLLLVPGMVRNKLPDAQIGFFLHTAFPSSEIFRCLATRKALLEGMLGANLVAFQTPESVQHFLQTCARLLTVETTSEGVQLDDRFVNVTSQPIGIDPSALLEARKSETVRDWQEKIAERYKDKYLIVARDKLDKLLAYELFLNKYPQWAGKTVLIQVATSTSEQTELLATVTDICTRIDRYHGNIGFQPLVFLKQDIDFAVYMALLSMADCLMISALRDGMNLTAHGYVFCQDGKLGGKKHGPLILSEFTGSASILRGQISINPWDYFEHADAIKQAVEMTAEEKERRWTRLHRQVMQQTGDRWAEELHISLAKAYEEHGQRASTCIPRLSIPQAVEKYKQARKRLFIIDYEGTLAPHRSTTGIPLAQPHRIVATLNDVMADPKNTVYVMSSKGRNEINAACRTAIGLGMIAENGCFVRDYGRTPRDWYAFVDQDATKRWKSDVKNILKYYTERMEGSYVEERDCSLIFRYEKVEDQSAAMRSAGDCADQINSGCSSMQLQAIPISKAVLVEQAAFNKATAADYALNLLRKNTAGDADTSPDFLMVAGDDREDEVVFRWANTLANEGTIRDVFTVSVGKRNTEAQHAMTQGSTGLLSMLQKLANVSSDQMPVDYFRSHRRAS